MQGEPIHVGVIVFYMKAKVTFISYFSTSMFRNSLSLEKSTFY